MIASFREIWYTILYAAKSERVKPVKILIVSDSHGDSTYLRLAVKKERPDAIVHLGDHASDAYATVYPLSMFMRVLLAQLVLMLFL